MANVFTTLLVIGVFAAIAYRIMTPAEREKFAEQYIGPVIAEFQRCTTDSEPFRTALRARRRWVVVTPTLAIVTTVVFVAMVLNGNLMEGPQGLLAWGATEGSLTAGGEWWRLMTAVFVHAGILQLVVTLIGIVQVGALVERLVGPLTIACVYVAAGAFGHAARMASDVVSVHTGASAAIFGLYGVLTAGSAWGLLRRRGPFIPLAIYKLLAPGAVFLLLSCLLSDGLVIAHNVAGFAAGLIVGFAATMNARERNVALRPVAFATVAAVFLIACVLIPVQDIVGVKQQLSRLVIIEDRTADTYRQVLRRLTANGKRIDAKALTEVIDRSIVPQLAIAATEIVALETVMPEHEPLVASAKKYLRLREASWRLRAEGLRRGSMRLLQEADSMEQASIEALRPLKSPANDDKTRTLKPHEG